MNKKFIDGAKSNFFQCVKELIKSGSTLEYWLGDVFERCSLNRLGYCHVLSNIGNRVRFLIDDHSI